MVKTISIHSYRGGTGKSNSTANLATLVASQGKRVAVVDTDLPSPGIHILFGLSEEKTKLTLNDFLWERCPLSSAAYDVTHVLGKNPHPNSKIYLIPSSVKVNDISKVLSQGFDTERLFEGFQQLSKDLSLDYLFIDTHPGINDETLLSLSISDIVILMFRPDQQDFQGTAVTVEVARRLKVPKVLLIVNKALKKYNFEHMAQQLEKTYNTKVVGILAECDEMIELASRGIFSLKHPEHQISKVLSEVAKEISK